MRKRTNFTLKLTVFALVIPLVMASCKKEETPVATAISIDKTITPKLNVGEEAMATITIVADGVKAFKYYKVVDEVKGTAVDVTSQLVKSGNTYTYDFSYTVQEFDDLHTLGFEFEVTDNRDQVKTTALVVDVSLSVKSSFVKYDWKVTASEWLGLDVLAAWDAAYIYRFHQDGTYDVDMTAQYADSTHHFCYWVYKETPNNADTIAILRLIRKLRSGSQGVDEYYDYKITSATESQMIMYWDIPVFGLYGIKNTFTSQPKGAFQPYGTVEMANAVANIPVLSCSTVDNNLLTIP
ncbi:MAG TPA: hypothetical protein PLC81_10655 [Bacteroidales bacterium]|nr:hypothetical protein [Bacteroidales bacterium]HQK38087.1 hypothetical protein [Bacteroidales bacterium]